MLQLNTIPLNGKQPLREPGSDRDPIFGDCTLRQFNYLVDRLIKIKTILSRRRFLDLITDPVDDISGSIGIVYDTGKRFPDFPQIWWRLSREFMAARALLRAVAIGCVIS